MDIRNEILRNAAIMLSDLGREKAMSAALGYADDYEKSINNLTSYDPEKIDSLTKQRNFWLGVNAEIAILAATPQPLDKNI